MPGPIRTIVFAMSGALLITSALAGDIQRPRVYAIVVAIDQYADVAIHASASCETDAKALYDLLIANKTMATDPADVQLLLGVHDPQRKHLPATKANILNALETASRTAGREDVVIIAIAGRGAPLGSRSCFFATDSTVKGRWQNAVAAADIERSIEKLNSRKVLAILDVNCKEFDPSPERLAETDPRDLLQSFIGKIEKWDSTLIPGRVVFAADCNLKPRARSLTAVVTEGLAGKADISDGESDGLLTVKELGTHIESAFGGEVKKKVEFEPNRKNFQPAWYWHGDEQFILAVNPDIREKTDARIKQLADARFGPDITGEGTRLLSQIPSLQEDRELRKLYEKWATDGLTKGWFLEARKNHWYERGLSEEECKTFADAVLEASKTIRAAFVRDDDLPGTDVRNAIVGLFESLDAEMPASLAKYGKSGWQFEEKELRRRLTVARQALGRAKQLENNFDAELAISAMIRGLGDRRSKYYFSEERDLGASIEMRPWLGIGAEVRPTVNGIGLVVVSVDADGAANSAGLKVGDLITHIKSRRGPQGEQLSNAATVKTNGMTVWEAEMRLRGSEKTEVGLTVDRQGEAAAKALNLTLKRAGTNSVFGVGIQKDGTPNVFIDAAQRIGYVRVTDFAPNTSQRMDAILKEFAKKDPAGLILDLRFNRGGLLVAAVELCEFFVDDGLLVEIKPRVGQSQEYKGGHDKSYASFPMVCLINGESASASEFLAACLQDHRRAIIMGERSCGKGSVQTLHSFRQTGGELKMTTALFYRPNGKCLSRSPLANDNLNEWGVQPDKGYLIPLSIRERFELAEHLDNQKIGVSASPNSVERPPFVDRQLEAALDYLRQQAKNVRRVPAK